MTAIDLFSRCAHVSLDEFGEHFTSCKHAFRLELLESYAEDSERPFFELYKKGSRDCPSDFNVEWLELLREARERGAEFYRARYRPAAKLSAYMQFEFDWGYKRNVVAGENIAQFGSETLQKIKRHLGFALDFWLFDQEYCYLLIYDIEGEFLGVTRVDSSDTQLIVEAAKLAMIESEAVAWN